MKPLLIIISFMLFMTLSYYVGAMVEQDKISQIHYKVMKSFMSNTHKFYDKAAILDFDSARIYNGRADEAYYILSSIISKYRD